MGSSILGVGFLISVFLAIYNDINGTHYNTDVLAALGTLGEIFIFNYALQQKTNQQEKELIIAQYEKNKILDNEHMRLSADLHDEVGSSLSSVHIHSLMIQKKMPQMEDGIKSHVLQITEQVSSIMQSISDIVWGFRSDLNTVDDLMIRLSELLHQTLEPNNIKYRINIMPTIKKRQLNNMQRSNLILLFKEAVNNILKYAQATEVTINLNAGNSFFTFEIIDNGIGFIQEAPDFKPGNGLRNMKKRMQQLNGSFTILAQPDSGTTLKFKFPF